MRSSRGEAEARERVAEVRAPWPTASRPRPQAPAVALAPRRLDDDADAHEDDERDALHTQMELHDRFGIELKIHSGSTGESSSQVHYELQAYLFFPRSFGITSKTYPSSRFFGDSKALLRREPQSLWLRDAATGRRLPRIDRSLLEALRDQVQARIEANQAQPAEAARHVLLFGSALRRTVKEMRRLFKPPPRTRFTPDEVRARLAELPEYLRELGHFYAEYRTFRRNLRHAPEIVDREYAEAALTVDEMASYLFEDALARLDRGLARVVKRFAEHADIYDEARRLRAVLTDAARVELAYRRRKGFCIHGVSHTGREYFLYRVGQLKKAIDSALYFDIRTLDSPSRVKHIIGGIGAALGASWAFFAQVGSPGGPTITGVSTFVVFSLAVAAYIAKDRIKDLTKEKLSRWYSKRNPDRHSVFDHHEMLGAARLHGELRESTRWLDEAKLPEIVRAIRDSGHVVDVVDDRHETVLFYKKQVDYGLAGHDDDPVVLKANSVKDLFRFTIRNFLKSLDDPQRRVSFFDVRENAFTSAEAPKVYHINVVLVYRVHAGDPHAPRKRGVAAPESRTTWERIRVILTRQGIERLETVLPRDTHAWLTAPPPLDDESLHDG